MQLSIIQTLNNPGADEFVERITMHNLRYYASDAADVMDFESNEEMYDALKRAMELCLFAGIPIKGNFQSVYKSSAEGIIYDCKLSTLAYRLMCLSGKSSNPNVAQLTIQILNNKHLNHS
jgi:hypothetical protein